MVLPNTEAGYGIIGPVVDHVERKLYYIKSTDCGFPANVCGVWELIQYDIATNTETSLYEAMPWDFPLSSAFLVGTFAGRSVMAFDPAAKVIYWTAVPRNSIKQLSLFSADVSGVADLARLKKSSGLAHCQIRVRHTWNGAYPRDQPDHVAYNGLAASCDGKLYLAINNELWRFDGDTDIMTKMLSTAQQVAAGVTGGARAVALGNTALYFATASGVWRIADPTSATGSSLSPTKAYVNTDIVGLPKSTTVKAYNDGMPYISSIAVDPHTDAVYIVGDVYQSGFNTKVRRVTC